MLVLLLLLLGRGSLPGVVGSKVIGRRGWLEVVLWIDERGELVGKVLVVSVHFHRSMLVGDANAFPPLNQIIN